MHVLLYIPWFIKEIIVAGFTVIFSVLRPDSGLDPVVVRYPLRVTTQWQRFWFSTCITATPSTLSLGFREPQEPGQPRILLVQAAFGSQPVEVFRSLADMEERMAPHVKDIDYGVPGHGDYDELDPSFYEYPEGRKER